MQTLIAGGGSVGARIALFLSDRGENVILIDEDRQRCEWVSKNSDAQVYNGSILDPALLMEAGIDKVDALVTALGNDETTRKLVDLAKSQFGVPKVLAVAKSSEVKERIKESGADKVVCSEEIVLKELEDLLESKGRKTLYFDKENDLKVSRISLRATSEAIGWKVSKLPTRGAKVVAIERRGAIIYPHEDTELEMADELFVIGNDQSVQKLESLIEQGS